MIIRDISIDPFGLYLGGITNYSRKSIEKEKIKEFKNNKKLESHQTSHGSFGSKSNLFYRSSDNNFFQSNLNNQRKMSNIEETIFDSFQNSNYSIIG